MEVDEPLSLDDSVDYSALKHRVDPDPVRAVIEAESNWNPEAVSPKGAVSAS